jgi:phosphate transport system substrate-binding protein
MPIPKIPADAMGDGSYPILSLTWILCNETYDNALKLRKIKEVFNYCLTEGQKHNARLGYLSLPEPLLSKARMKVDSINLKK